MEENKTKTVDIIDPALQDMAPQKRMTEPMRGWLGAVLNKKVTEVFKVGD